MCPQYSQIFVFSSDEPHSKFARHIPEVTQQSSSNLCDNRFTGPSPSLARSPCDLRPERSSIPLSRAHRLCRRAWRVLHFGVSVWNSVIIRVIPPVKTQSVAQLTFSGGSHAIRIELPIDQFAAHTREPAEQFLPPRRLTFPCRSPPSRVRRRLHACTSPRRRLIHRRHRQW